MENTLNGEKSFKIKHISVNNRTPSMSKIWGPFFLTGLIKPKNPSHATVPLKSLLTAPEGRGRPREVDQRQVGCVHQLQLLPQHLTPGRTRRSHLAQQH